MRTSSVSLRAAVLLTAMTGAADPSFDGTPLTIPPSWNLVFEDDFSGTGLDGTKWRLGQHWAGITGGGGTSPDNVSVSGGLLRIDAEKRTVDYGGQTYDYACAEVTTFKTFSFKYGYLEARIKWDAIRGVWPAFWTMPDRGNYGWPEGYYESYLKFDLSGVAASSVSKAELVLTVTDLDSNSKNLIAFKVHDDAWQENTITWANKPVRDPLWLDQKYDVSPSVGDTIRLDVTEFVNEELPGDKTVSLCLADTFMRTGGLRFGSRDGTATNRPRLELTGYSALVPVADAYVRAGSYAGTNYGTSTGLKVDESWDDCATTYNGGMEVDVMETLGIWGADRTQHAIHWDGYGSDHQSIGWGPYSIPATDDGFHTFGMLWQEGSLKFYVDRQFTYQHVDARVCSVPSYILVSLQMGGWDGNHDIDDAGITATTDELLVDWVRVYDVVEGGDVDAPAPPRGLCVRVAGGD